MQVPSARAEPRLLTRRAHLQAGGSRLGVICALCEPALKGHQGRPDILVEVATGRPSTDAVGDAFNHQERREGDGQHPC